MMSQGDGTVEPNVEVESPTYTRVPHEGAHAPARAPMLNTAARETSRGRPVLIPALIAGVILLVGVAPLEYGFYTVLRIAVTLAAVLVAAAAVRSRQLGWLAVAVAIAILFNPLIPFSLSKGVWVPIDLACAALLVLAGVFVGSRRAE